MATNLSPFLKFREWDSNGNLLAGGKLYTYQAGTTTPQATYTDSGGGTPNANPVVLDASGTADVWLDTSLSYKFVLKDSSDNTIWTVDNVIGLLANNTVTTASIQDDAVTTAKLADGSVTADILKADATTDGNRAVTTNHIRDSAVTAAKLASGAVTLAKLGAGGHGVSSSGVISKTASFTAASGEDVYLCDATLGAITVTLPAASGLGGKFFTFKKTDSSTNAITLDGASAETIDGATTYVISNQYESVTIMCDGSNWHVV